MVITFLEGSCIIMLSSALIGCFTVQLNMRGIETALESTITFKFHFRDSRSHVLCLFILWSGSTYHTFYKIRCLTVGYSFDSSQYLLNFWWLGCVGSAGIEHGRVYANVGGVHISDPDCKVPVGGCYVQIRLFFSGLLHSQDLHKKEETMVFEAHGMSFPCTEVLLFHYAKVNTVFHSMAPLKLLTTDSKCINICLINFKFKLINY